MITLELDIFPASSTLKVRVLHQAYNCCGLFPDGIPEMFDGAEVNEAEVLAWISKELATNEVTTFLIETNLISNQTFNKTLTGETGEQSRGRDADC